MICLLYTKNYARDTEINKMWQLHFVSPTSVEKDRCTMSTQYFCPSGKLQNSPLVYQINVQCVSPRQSDGFSCHHHRDSLKLILLSFPFQSLGPSPKITWLFLALMKLTPSWIWLICKIVISCMLVI